MTTFAVLATGPSMSQDIADYVHGRCRAVAVCNAYRLAPWADALVCNDRNWWSEYPEALKFEGRKFSSRGVYGTEAMMPTPEFRPGCNSGMQGMRVARMLGAERVLLLGFDMHGTHYFGPHPAPLSNTTEKRFAEFIQQFEGWRGGCEVLNCTPGSALKRFPFAELKDVL